ncbi:hypothetical protein ILT44_21080 [Microvirga sp. BT689]|uniref:hypothetical protein n=1 Tax=Microvirga arvi TaxID=2778731 RepID=UPI001951C7FA|nr:hypothetical protein [Microvirga arvi]MBM6582702.1 hypothetical protein [Microvirga arvi]
MIIQNDLYFIAATDGNGENLDLLVRATTAAQAVDFLLDYYNVKRASIDRNLKVFLVPSTQRAAGPLPWHSSVQQVEPKEIDQPISQQMHCVCLLDQEHDTVLAALRVYQYYLNYQLCGDAAFDIGVGLIASAHAQALTSDEIDELCERINSSPKRH